MFNSNRSSVFFSFNYFSSLGDKYKENVACIFFCLLTHVALSVFSFFHTIRRLFQLRASEQNYISSCLFSHSFFFFFTLVNTG